MDDGSAPESVVERGSAEGFQRIAQILGWIFTAFLLK